MKVELLSTTPDALDLLLFTKSTRLTMSGTGLEEVRTWSPERKAKELEYMRNTIQSSWEFVDYVFAITGVTRAFTHQLVRHRVGTSFAQQAQRVVDLTGFTYVATGPELNWEGQSATERSAAGRDGDPGDNPSNIYDATMQSISRGYQKLRELGVKPQDARGVIPTNVTTSIIFKANLRTLHEMALKRLCVKAQGEFQDVFRLIREQVVAVHPWTEPFIRVHCAWHGVCAFPTLPTTECPVKRHVYDQSTGKAYGWEEGYDPLPGDALHTLSMAHRAEIQPVVKATP